MSRTARIRCLGQAEIRIGATLGDPGPRYGTGSSGTLGSAREPPVLCGRPRTHMLNLKQPKRPAPTDISGLAEIRASIVVLSEVNRQLGERIEILETRETLRRFELAKV